MLSEPEYILGVRGGSHSLMLLEPESILGVMGGEPEFMLPEPESKLSCENWVSPSPQTLDFGLGLDNKSACYFSKERRKTHVTPGSSLK